tara:strand:- start:494 stop:733 length:240 start_codon:yes stop_codon:yes gene_type:complete
MKLLVEAIAVGVITVVVGTIAGLVVGKLFSSNLPKVCKKWNKNHVMEISLFLTGFLVHLLCEFTGINGWYCKNGRACKK